MTIDATMLANYITLSANGSSARHEDFSTNDTMFSGMLAQAFTQSSTEQTQGNNTGARSAGTDNMMSLIYMMMGSGFSDSSGTLGLVAQSFGKAVYGGTATTGAKVQGERANNLYQLFASGSNGATHTARSTDGRAITPVAASVAVTPKAVSTIDNRSAALYRSVIDQFHVETNPRYAVNKKGKGDTYCNIFMWDVTRAMGAEIPHYVDPETLEPRYYPDVKGARELNANAIYDWLGNVGERYGWYQVGASQAQDLANQGHPVVTARKNESGHGHVQVVCPSQDGTYDAKRGVTIAQAGKNLLSEAYITRIYSDLDEVVYYAHA